ncbi:hypothetical protein L9F63_005699 [Diploptera punctata]|uniref:Lipid droplet-associated hydrolase n=1 Tax=Diploptera punctata TaxID=6984 RepID=A0AAD8E5L8_DIPPU|nr:hypothetical protein L9F63_005699 [Diploptera punctata]
MKEGFVDINGIPTHVITWGGWVENKLNDDVEDIILLVTGNPGLADYYIPFVTKLHSQLDIPIWAVSFAGHVKPPSSLPKLEKDPNLYNLQSQVENKLAFIEKYIPNNVNIILIGHSIGAKIIIDMLANSDSIRSRVSKAYLLFPTIERMAESWNGKIMTRIIKHLVPIIIFLSWIFTLFPLFIKKLLLSLHFILRRIPTYHVAPTLKLINPTVLGNVFNLALEEMEKVRELDDKVIRQLSDVLFLYYGTTDGWVPVEYWKNMTEKHPEVKCKLCENKFDHAFVLRYSQEMADVLTDLINEHKL